MRKLHQLICQFSWDVPSPTPQLTGLIRTKGAADTWKFTVILQNVEFVGEPNWTYSPNGDADNWGQWNLNEGKTSLDWIAPAGGLKKAGSFNVKVSGKIRKKRVPGAGPAAEGEEEIKDFGAEWGGQIYDAKMTTPSGDPTESSKINEGRNEFTFDRSEDGYCYVTCEATITPDNPGAEQWAEQNVSWSITQITGSELTWGDGVRADFVVGDNKGKKATARFKGLPPTNDGFGLKTVTMTAGEKVETGNVEIFFSKYGLNHPGGNQSPPSGEAPEDNRSPNWFYYWNQQKEIGADNAFYNYKAQGGGGWTPALGQWRLGHPYGDEIWIRGDAAEVFEPESKTRPGWRVTGIDNFANTIQHEKVHLEQIKRANALLTEYPSAFISKTGIWRSGWGWRIPYGFDDPADYPDNRWNPGPTPGSRIELDGNDDLIPDAWQTGGKYPYSELEVEAQRAEIRNPNNWKLDWGSPGKQHNTNEKEDD